MNRALVVVALAVSYASRPAVAQVTAQGATREALIARAQALELDTPYQPVPGTTIEYQAVGYATVMCTGMFISGLDSAFVAENTGYFTAPYEVRPSFRKVRIDRAARLVGVTTPDGTERVARLAGSQGCVALPRGRTEPFFTPVAVKSALPDPSALPWPMGNAPSNAPWPTGVDRAKVAAAVEAAFDPAGMTASFVVLYQGQIIGERYGEGVTMRTPLEGWSMGKSVSGTLLATLIQKGVYTLDQPAPFPQWQRPGDPRQQIAIRHIVNMSSGLRIRAAQDPDYDPNGPYPDHLWYYTGTDNAAEWAATRPQQYPPNAVGRYRNTDPVLTNYLTRLGAEKLGVPHLEYPQRALFDKIGVRDFVMLTDPYGNFLTHGAQLAPARDWARIAQLHLQDGVWNGERILPAGWVDFVSSLAPAWVADGRPTYGGLFWINGEDAFPAPRSAYYMSGVGGNTALIIPTHDLVVVRMGHYRGQGPGGRALREAVRLLLEAVPPT
jgi:CubicO group peptidase (beta-lactamase class C family)